MPFLVYRGSGILGRPVGTPKNSSNFKIFLHCTIYPKMNPKSPREVTFSKIPSLWATLLRNKLSAEDRSFTESQCLFYWPQSLVWGLKAEGLWINTSIEMTSSWCPPLLFKRWEGTNSIPADRWEVYASGLWPKMQCCIFSCNYVYRGLYTWSFA